MADTRPELSPSPLSQALWLCLLCSLPLPEPQPPGTLCSIVWPAVPWSDVTLWTVVPESHPSARTKKPTRERGQWKHSLVAVSVGYDLQLPHGDNAGPTEFTLWQYQHLLLWSTLSWREAQCCFVGGKNKARVMRIFLAVRQSTGLQFQRSGARGRRSSR